MEIGDGFFSAKLHSKFFLFLEISNPCDIHGSVGFTDLLNFLTVKGKKVLNSASKVDKKLFVAS